MMHSLQGGVALSQLAQVLEVSPSGFAAHLRKAQRPRHQADQRLKPLWEQAFVASRRSYGSPRLRIERQKLGYRCGQNRIRRLMRPCGLRPKQKRRFRPLTTRSDPRRAAAPNWLAQVPAPTRPNQIWVSDITYLPTAQGWLFLAATLDACSRKCVGYSLAEGLDTPLVTEAWERAQRSPRPGPGLLHHSNRGTQ